MSPYIFRLYDLCHIYIYVIPQLLYKSTRESWSQSDESMNKAISYAWSEALIHNTLAFILTKSPNTPGCFPIIYTSIMAAG